MTNQIFINEEGIMELILEGKVSVKMVLNLISQSMDVTVKIMEQGKPIRTLIDMSGITDFSDTALALAQRMFGFTPFDKMAFFGGNQKVKNGIGTLISNWKGGNEKVQQFDTREQALAWLKQ